MTAKKSTAKSTSRKPAPGKPSSATTAKQRVTRKKARATPHAGTWKPAFLEAFKATGIVTVAASRAGVTRVTVWRARKTDPEFAAAYGEAFEDAADMLEAEARRRAVHGWDEPVFWKGEQVGSVRKYDSTLLIFLLKGFRPERYRDRIDVRHMSDEALETELERVESELRAAGVDLPPAEE